MLPIACWLFLIAALATVAIAVLLVTLRRPSGWRWIRWSGAAATLGVFAVFSLTLLSFGLLGFWTW
jgi:hypothetical protein